MEKPITTEVVILAAGKGTRIGSDLPKVLVEVGGKSMIRYLLEELDKVSSIKPIIVVGFKYNLVQNALGKHYTYAFQEGQLGTGHAVLAAKPYSIANELVVLYGDTPFIKAGSIAKLIEHHQAHKSNLTLFTTVVPNFENEFLSLKGFGRILRNSSNEIEGIKEFADASEDERNIQELNSGVYIFNTSWLWDNLPKVNRNNKQNEYYLTDIVKIAKEQSEPINSLLINPMEVFGINSQKQLEQAERLSKSGEV